MLMDLRVRKEGHTYFHVGEDRKVHDKFRLHKEIASELRMAGFSMSGMSEQR